MQDIVADTMLASMGYLPQTVSSKSITLVIDHGASLSRMAQPDFNQDDHADLGKVKDVLYFGGGPWVKGGVNGRNIPQQPFIRPGNDSRFPQDAHEIGLAQARAGVTVTWRNGSATALIDYWRWGKRPMRRRW
jgi:hypothetical protein